MEKNIKQVTLIDLGEQDEFRPGDRVILQPIAAFHDWLVDKAIEIEGETSRLIRKAIVDHLNSGGDLPGLNSGSFGDKLFVSMKTGRTMALIEM